MNSNRPENQTSAVSTRESRRQAVRRILELGGTVAGAAGLSGSWARPVVQTVVLPAHAQTTDALVLTDPCDITVTCTSSFNFTLDIEGAAEPPTGGLDVRLEIRMLFNDSEQLSETRFVTTNGAGEYSFSETFGSVVVNDIVVTVTLVDFPEVDSAQCSIVYTESGPHSPYSAYYFCSSGPI